MYNIGSNLRSSSPYVNPQQEEQQGANPEDIFFEISVLVSSGNLDEALRVYNRAKGKGVFDPMRNCAYGTSFGTWADPVEYGKRAMILINEAIQATNENQENKESPDIKLNAKSFKVDK